MHAVGGVQLPLEVGSRSQVEVWALPCHLQTHAGGFRFAALGSVLSVGNFQMCRQPHLCMGCLAACCRTQPSRSPVCRLQGMLRNYLTEMTARCRDSWPLQCIKTSLLTGQKQPALGREQSQPSLHPGREGLLNCTCPCTSCCTHHQTSASWAAEAAALVQPVCAVQEVLTC